MITRIRYTIWFWMRHRLKIPSPIIMDEMWIITDRQNKKRDDDGAKQSKPNTQ